MIRYFCHVTLRDGLDPIADLGFSFYEELKESSVPIRVVATNMADLAMYYRVPCSRCVSGEALRLQCDRCEGTGSVRHKSRWGEFSEDFTREVGKSYVNIVCGDNGELTRLYTLGTTNIAILQKDAKAPIPTLQQYDAVVVSDEDEARILQEEGVAAVCANPKEDTVNALVRKFL